MFVPRALRAVITPEIKIILAAVAVIVEVMIIMATLAVVIALIIVAALAVGGAGSPFSFFSVGVPICSLY